MQKNRLDVILVSRGYFPSREKARSNIMAGMVYVNGEKVDKPGARFSDDVEITIKRNINPYVSRGGLKLEKAIDYFNIALKGKTAMDVGASTGGFTDCMLKKGASKVFAVDVGYGQLAWTLRNDSRVVCMERTNIRNLKHDDIGMKVDFATIDVSFISLKKVLPVVGGLLSEYGEAVCLIKPQFEAGRDKVGKKGVVKEPEIHKDVLESVALYAAENGFKIKGFTFSPIKGPEGNIEYFLYVAKEGESIKETDIRSEIEKVVEEAHECFKKEKEK